jgi:hypothetical protein
MLNKIKSIRKQSSSSILRFQKHRSFCRKEHNDVEYRMPAQFSAPEISGDFEVEILLVDGYECFEDYHVIHN